MNCKKDSVFLKQNEMHLIRINNYLFECEVFSSIRKEDLIKTI